MNVAWIFVCLVIIFVQDGYAILCYHCHQTTKECNNGRLDYLRQKNCSEDRCAIMKYETPMPGRKVLATIRDCAAYTEHELLRSVSTDNKKPARIVLFEECNSPLCNLSSKLQISTKVLLLMTTVILCLLNLPS